MPKSLYITNPDLVQIIIKDAITGMPVILLERTYKISRPAIERILKKENITPADGRIIAATKKKKQFPCVVCNTMFFDKESRYKSKENKTCSKTCSSILRSKNNLYSLKDQIIQLSKTHTLTEVALIIKTPTKQLSYWAKKNNFSFFKKRCKIPSEIEMQKITELVLSGSSILDLSKNEGWSRRYITAEIKKRIIDHKHPNYLSDEEVKNRLHPNMELIEKIDAKRYKVRCRNHPKEEYLRQAADLGGDCIKCGNNGQSSEEINLLSWIKHFYPEASKHKIGRKEIDIYIPSLNLGIEYCGLYWHSESIDSNKNKHLNKLKIAESQGIRLITIFEDEWLYKKAQVKNFLLSNIKRNTTIGARKCFLRLIEPTLASVFFNTYHIQGSSRSKISFGLFYNNELVGAISGSNHHRGKCKDLVLSRLCFKDGISVAGGASKLFNQLKIWAKENGYNKIISWSDNRWSEGNVYKVLGFTLEAEFPPDYSYVKNTFRFSKQSLKKTKEEQLLNITEYELRNRNGYNRIWDCGKKRWAILI